VITELMCNGRVDLNMVGQRFGVDAIAYFGPEIGLVASLAEEGLAEMDDAVIQATPLGRLFIRRLAMAFDSYLEPDSLPLLRPASRQRPR
jgi:oxygen-independent coproporphyrinogen-3 oxidase